MIYQLSGRSFWSAEARTTSDIPTESVHASKLTKSAYNSKLTPEMDKYQAAGEQSAKREAQSNRNFKTRTAIIQSTIEKKWT